MPRKDSLNTVSLFPFLSILVCMMGVLAFIMICIAVVSAINPYVELDRESLTSVSKTPSIVECQPEGAVLHPHGLEVPLNEIGEENSPFMQLMQRLARNKDEEYLFLAVYPAGIDCFNQARRLAESKSLDLGFEPMLEGWQFNPEQSRGSTDGKKTQ